MRVFSAGIPDAEARTALKRLTAGDELWLSNGNEFGAADRSAFLQAEIVLGAFPPDLLLLAEPLRWVQLLSVGLDSVRNYDWPLLGGRVVCSNLRGVFADAMAQSVIAGILALNRGVDRIIRFQDKSDWQKDYLHSKIRVLRGAHVLLLGIGSVGTRLREVLSLFGCTFTTYGRTSGDIHSLRELDASLSSADLVCAALPDTPDTRGLLDARRIALMKEDALFINVGRGSLLDETALVQTLHVGKLRGAVLDVTLSEPLPPGHPLWPCPRLILTQHTAAGSHDEYVMAVEFFGRNLARYRTGAPLLNVIDWAKGY